jgi:hypothetical protein
VVQFVDQLVGALLLSGVRNSVFLPPAIE